MACHESWVLPYCPDRLDSDWLNGNRDGKAPRCTVHSYPWSSLFPSGSGVTLLSHRADAVFVPAEDMELVPYARESCSVVCVILRNVCVWSVPVPWCEGSAAVPCRIALRCRAESAEICLPSHILTRGTRATTLLPADSGGSTGWTGSFLTSGRP